MPLINCGILGNLNTGSILPAVQQGLTLGQAINQFNQQKQEQDRQFSGLTSQGMGLLAQGLGLSSQPQLIQAGQIHRPQMNGFAIPGLLGGSIYG